MTGSTTSSGPLRAVPDAPPTPADLKRRADWEAFTALRATGDPRLRNRLIEDHQWLAHHAARRFAGRGEHSDDLVQVAAFGLVNAVDRLDPDQGARFSTCAMPTMLGEHRRHPRDQTKSQRVARRNTEPHGDRRRSGGAATTRPRTARSAAAAA